MPDEVKYKPLSPEEKAEIIALHKELVERFNRSLPDNKKLSIDPNLEKKLDDPKKVAIYRIAQEMKQVRETQKKIRENLEAKFGKSQQRIDPLSRTLFYAIDPSGTKEAEAYNEKLYQDYLNDPSKIVFMRYGKVQNIDPTEICKCNDDPLKLAEYYRDTYPLCEEGFAFLSVVTTSDLATPEMKSALTSVAKPMEMIGYPVNMMRAATIPDFLAMPDLDFEQCLILQNADKEWIAERGDSFKRIMDEFLVQNVLDKPADYFNKIAAKGVKLEKGMFVKLRPETFEVGPKGEHINVEEAKWDQFIDPRPGQNIQVAERDPNNLEKVAMMNRSFQNKYYEKWKQTFNKKMNIIGEMDIASLERRNKGGFFENYIWFSTSKQYKEFVQAFKDYHDPKSPNYMNKANLNKKGQAYLDRKIRKNGSLDTSKMDSTSRGRTEWVQNTLSTLNEVTVDSVAKEWLADYKPEIKREPFLKPKDVALEEEKKSPTKDITIEKEAKVEKSNDGPELNQ